MTHSQHLEVMLAATVKHVRALHATLAAVMVEVAALRQTVLNESEDLSRFKNKIETATEKARPLVQSALRSYDELIRRITDSTEGKREESPAASDLRNVIH